MEKVFRKTLVDQLVQLGRQVISSNELLGQKIDESKEYLGQKIDHLGQKIDESKEYLYLSTK